MADIIQIRRDTAANWTSSNPTLAQGEIGLETDTNKRKTGTGSATWTALKYDVPFTDQKTGTAITFVYDTVYGTIGTPETGNITASYTGAKLGTSVLILHQAGSEPTYPAQFKKMSGTYDTTKINRIYCMYLDNNTVDYSISHE